MDWNERMRDFDRCLKEKMEEWKVPGLALAIVKDGNVILSGGYGLRNKAGNKEVTENTVFAIGSSTKAFTASAAGILADEGKLEWDAPVKKYMPWFKMYDPVASDRVTVRDMLCHRTGLPRHEAMWYGSPFSRREIVERIRYLQPSKDFRSAWQYQNHMLAAVGCLIEEIAGVSWEEFVGERILKPLEMNGSSFSVEASRQASDHSCPYAAIKDTVVEIPFANVDTIGPAGSINSTVKDMTGWLLMNLNKGRFKDRQIISGAAVSQLHSPQIPGGLNSWRFKELQLSCYGLGWFIECFRGHKIIHHGGMIDGFSALVSFMPEENTGMVILTNLTSRYPFVSAIQYEVYDRLLGYEGKDWSREIKEQLAQAAAAAAKKPENHTPPCSRDAEASYPLKDYSGKYENPGYGTATIEENGDRLNISYNVVKTVLQYNQPDIFQLNLEVWGISLPVTFHRNADGDVDRLCVPFGMDPAVKEIEFVRLPV